NDPYGTGHTAPREPRQKGCGRLRSCQPGGGAGARRRRPLFEETLGVSPLNATIYNSRPSNVMENRKPTGNKEGNRDCLRPVTLFRHRPVERLGAGTPGRVGN